MCELYGKEPDDDFFENMNPYKKLWLYESWAHKQEIEMEKEKNQAILIGSFYNPEMARKMVEREKPQIQSSDEDFEKSIQFVQDSVRQQEENQNKRVSRRKRRKIYR